MKKIEYEKYENMPISRIREVLQLTPITINDYPEVTERTNNYLIYCDENNRIPTIKGLCASLGITSRTLTNWLTKNPEHQTSQYLAMVKEVLADNLENGALNGTLNPITSMFLLKSQHQYREDEDYSIKLKTVTTKNLKVLESEIENEIIEADFSEKSTC